MPHPTALGSSCPLPWSAYVSVFAVGMTVFGSCHFAGASLQLALAGARVQERKIVVARAAEFGPGWAAQGRCSAQ